MSTHGYARAKKVAKSQTQSKALVISHAKPYKKWDTEYLQIVSVDVGKKHYAIRCERRYTNGTTTPLVYELYNIIENCEEKGMYTTLTIFLDTYYDIFSQSHVFVIEKQLSENYIAVRLSQHTLTYFLIKFTDNVYICEIDARVKSMMFGVKDLNSRGLKKWSVEKAKEICLARGDEASYNVLERKTPKRDDLADTVTQLEGLLRYLESSMYVTYGV